MTTNWITLDNKNATILCIEISLTNFSNKVKKKKGVIFAHKGSDGLVTLVLGNSN